MANAQPPKCKNLVLDAGPLLSLSPLRGLAEKYLTVPQVLAELKDNRARQHFEQLGLLSGVQVEVRSPEPASVSHVIQWSKKTGDYSVLSHADICVLALTHTLHEESKALKEKEQSSSTKEIESDSQENTLPAPNAETELDREVSQESDPQSQPEPAEEAPIDSEPSVDEVVESFDNTTLHDSSSEILNEPSQDEAFDISQTEDMVEEDLEPLDVELTRVQDEASDAPSRSQPADPVQAPSSESRRSPSPIYDDPSDEDDGEGEWITPANVGLHKSKATNLLPDTNVNGKQKKNKDEIIGAGCMTADFAMQNVLLQMGLNLVGLEGKRIEKVKTWVLRCHACFKICKDNSKKFCPSCGNNTLLRASVTLSSPTASANAPAMQVHLKPNFQYRVRGTKYSIPAPKPGSAKTGSRTGLILREDQTEYMRAKQVADGKREREEAKMVKGIFSKGVDGSGNTGVSSWMDPDWVPEIVSVGAGGKGRTMRNSKMDGDMPQIGYGKKNPNERRRKK